MAKLVRAEEMAAVLGVTLAEVAVLVRSGMPEESRDKFDPSVAVPWFLAHMRTRIFASAKKHGIILR